MTTTIITLEEVKEKLKADGFTGLYYPGECACCIDVLAPCGALERDEDGEDYINGCEGGHKHIDPRDPDNWCISGCNESPSLDAWIRSDGAC
jgi:hypothetical protein